MKTDKVTRVLILYHQLMHGAAVNEAWFCMEHGIDRRSFDRDIEDIRLFLSVIFVSKELRYDKINNVYFFVIHCLDLTKR
ncbi:MAG: hypothetical protein IJB35_04205 [Oscillospiraceae bacterium]|nr:hypothetical protein [Oscillospiraceae bacterium]